MEPQAQGQLPASPAPEPDGRVWTALAGAARRWREGAPKRRRRIRIAAIVFLAVFIPAQLFLTLGVTPAVKKHALPPAREYLGMSLDVQSVAASLLGAKARVQGLVVGNPAGFEEAEMISAKDILVNLGAVSTCLGTLTIDSCRLRGARVTIVANDAGQTNVMALVEKIPTSDSPMIINNTRADGVIDYIGHLGTNTARLSFTLAAEADGLEWATGRTNHWGTFGVTGHMTDLPTNYLISIQGKVAVITNQAAPTFVVDGCISNVNTTVLTPFIPNALVESEDATITFHLNCRDGAFQPDSVIGASLRRIHVTPHGRKKLKTSAIPANLVVEVQVTGTVQKPDVDLIGTIRRSLLGSASRGLDHVMRSAGDFLNRVMTRSPADDNSSDESGDKPEK